MTKRIGEVSRQTAHKYVIEEICNLWFKSYEHKRYYWRDLKWCKRKRYILT